jgi:clan AA aspartic protease (TIGR02281 family)
VLVIRVTIGDGQAELLVDTGCAVTAITPRAAERLGLDRRAFAGRQAVFTAGGASIVVPTGRIPSLRLGVVELRDLEVALMELPPGVNLDGLLGVNALDRFRATFDFRHAALVLRPEPLR